jgi:hypothetical protein
MHYPELTDIYRKHFSECSRTINQIISSGAEPPTDPLLISPPLGYYDSDFKIMYFGQEVNCWEGPFHESKGVDHLLEVYDRFANNGGGFRYGGQFWNALKQLNESFSKLHTSLSFTYNNIIKIGKHEAKGLPSEPLLIWQKTWFQVIREEVRILTPDLIVFFTGPDYDKFLQEAFGPIEFTQVGARSTRQLSRVRARGLPVNTFRTYHPNYLWRHDFCSYERDIIDASRA